MEKTTLKPSGTKLDQRLLSDIARMDSEEAFGQLYDAYTGEVRRFVSMYLGTDGVEEVVSDVFLSLWNNRKALPDIRNLDAWLYQTARYRSISVLRKRKAVSVGVDEVPLSLFAGTVTTPEDDCISKETVERINDAIELLPSRCKMVFKLIREDKFTHKEVAAFMDISEKTVAAHMTAAIKKIRTYLHFENIKAL